MQHVILGILVAVGLTCAPCVWAQPDVDFGQVEVGHDSTIAVHFQFPDSGIVYFRVSGAPYYVVPASWHFAQSQDSVEAHVHFAPQEVGVFEDSLRYSCDDIQGGIALRGEGVEAHAAGSSFIPHPSSFILSASPNPFNPQTHISFALPEAERVNLGIFDVLGQQLMTLHEGLLTAGEHTIQFDGSRLSAGIYFARLFSPHRQATLKLMLIK
jgi:hypothetical protein